MIKYQGEKQLNKFNRVEFKIGEEFVLLGRTYRCVDSAGMFSCPLCRLPTCGTNIACGPEEREDGASVEFELVYEKEEGGEE